MVPKLIVPEFQSVDQAVDGSESYRSELGFIRSQMLLERRPAQLGTLGIAESECLRRMGRPHEAQGAVKRAIAAFSEATDEIGLGWALWAKGNLQRQLSQLEAAVSSLSLAGAIGWRARSVRLWNYASAGIAETTRIQGLYRRSWAEHLRVLARFSSAGDARGVVWGLEGLAQMLKNSGDFGRGGNLFRAAQGVAEASGDMRGLAYALKGKGEVLVAVGRHRAGIALLENALGMFVTLDMTESVLYTRKSLGDAWASSCNPDLAWQEYATAIEGFERSGSVRGAAYSAVGLGALSHKVRGLSEYSDRLATADSFFRQAGVRYGQLQTSDELRKRKGVMYFALKS